MRLFTLPLAMSAVTLGGAFAKLQNCFSWTVFILLFVCGTLFQILSNLANDYGDACSGVDGSNRAGAPLGLVARGKITRQEMFFAIVFTAVLCCLFSAVLIYVSFGKKLWAWAVFGLLTAFTVSSAIRYTMGKNPYGYRAQGEFYVFVFFGLVSVAGSYVFYNAPLLAVPGFPACGAGFFGAAVLSANNIRDMKSDRIQGKDTLALRFGPLYARYFHLLLVGLGFLCWLVYFLVVLGWQYSLLLLFALPVACSALVVYKSYDIPLLYKQVKITALGTGFFHFVTAIVLFLK